MKKNIFTRYFSILPLTLVLYCNNICAEEAFSPTIGISSTSSGNRKVGEANIMIPFLLKDSNLNILDIKIKQDNHESVEGNLGLVNRSILADKVILGFYGYLDRRKVKSYLTVNQLTLGAELLSPNLDLRANIYFPENKKKELSPARKKFVREGTKVYVSHENAGKEAALPGFDLEMGIPLFIMAPSWDDKLGTRIFLAKYKFTRKNMGSNSGTRIRLEQKINCDLFDKKDFEIILNIGTGWNGKKHNSFLALGIKVPLDKNYQKSSRSKLQKRMMDTVVRDIDIVMQRSMPQVDILPLYRHGKEVRNIYFVEEKSQEGDGSYENPFSKIQLMNLLSVRKFVPTEYDMILPVTTSDTFNTTSISYTEYQDIINSCKATGIGKNELVELQTNDKTSFIIDNIPEHFPEYATKKVQNRIVQNEEKNSLLTELNSAIEKVDVNSKYSDLDVMVADKDEYFSSPSQVTMTDSQWVVIVDSYKESGEEATTSFTQTTDKFPLEHDLIPINIGLSEMGILKAAEENVEENNVIVNKKYDLTGGSITQNLLKSIEGGNINTKQQYIPSPKKVSLTNAIKKSIEDGSISSKQACYIGSPNKKYLTTKFKDIINDNSMKKEPIVKKKLLFK